jgi:murein DD-endopeptidase MepM/ murein hydrolase activator NlpD
VQAGDTLDSVAARFGLQRETLVWSNPELEADTNSMYIGQALIILPVDGAYHTVQPGETLTEIARTYKVTVEAIAECEYNGRGGEIAPGDQLVIPGGIKPYKPYFVRYEVGTIQRPESDAAPHLIWPVDGEISQAFWELHRAIDLAGDHGDVVVAVDEGQVVYASWESSGYGNLVIVDHGNGFVTYYGHLFGFYVDVGASVQQGEPLGVRGNTGRSSGPHLHFEIRHYGVQVDPLAYLPER